jgi:signal transduction histidine kinase
VYLVHPLAPADEAPYEAARAALNTARLRRLAPVMVVVHLALVGLFHLMPPAPAGNPVEVVQAWQAGIIALHSLGALFGAAVGAYLWWRGRTTPPGTGSRVADASVLAYLLLGAVVAGVDQAVTSAITPYLIGCFSTAVAFRTPARMAAAMSILGLAGFVVLQDHFQHAETLRLSNILNGTCIAALGLSLAMALNASHRREFAHTQVIARQREGLEAALLRMEAMARAAEAANEAKGAFLANMTHEVRTPINAVLGLARLLAQEVTDPRHLAWLASISGAARTLLVMLERVLDASRLEAGSISLEPTETALGPLVREVADAFEPRAREKGLALAVELSPDLPASLWLDDLRLRQVLFNLLSNAFKFTETGGITLRVHCHAGESVTRDVTLEVEDTGVGVPPEDRARIFLPFVQGQARGAPHLGGAGLGLSIVAGLVTHMGGRVTVDASPSGGAVFRVHLCLVPLVTPEGAPEPRPRAITLPPPDAFPAAYTMPTIPACGAAPLPEAVATLLLAEQARCVRRQEVAELAAFAELLASTGRAHASEAVLDYGVSLHRAVDVFDVATMLRLLNDFPTFLSTLQRAARAAVAPGPVENESESVS